MHRPFLRSSIAVASFSLLAVLSGCGSSTEGDDTTVNPAPKESTVFQAQGDTKSETGIAKWGFETDESGDLMTYRGYGVDNAVIAEVVQTFDRSKEDRWYYTLSAKGSLGSAVSKVEFFTRPAANGKDTEIMMVSTENTFVEGSGPAKVLAAFKSDAAKRGDTSLNAGGGSLVGKGLRPLDNGQLVNRCQELTQQCQTALIDQRIAASAASGDCGFLKRTGVPLVSAVVGGLVGAGLGVWAGGVGAVPGAAIGGVAGYAGSAAGAELQCAASRRDATQATNELNQCRAQQRQACSGG